MNSSQSAMSAYVQLLEAERDSLREELKRIAEGPCNCPCCSGACTEPVAEPFRQRTAQDLRGDV